jgi:hypothetical protein
MALGLVNKEIKLSMVFVVYPKENPLKVITSK